MQSPAERGFAEDNQMIEAFTANRSDDAFHIGTLPGRPGCREYFRYAQVPDLAVEIVAEDAIAITQQVTRDLVKRESFPQLLASPLGGRMGGDIEMEDPATVMSQHQEHVEDLEPNRGNREEIDRHQGLDVVVEESPPGLRRRLTEPDHVLADAGLPDVDAEFEKFTVDTRRTPQRVFSAHGADQSANILWHARATGVAVTDLPSPKKPKALPVPANDRFRLDYDQCGTPVAPGSAQPRPKEPIGRVQFRLLHRPIQDAELVAKGEVPHLHGRS